MSRRQRGQAEGVDPAHFLSHVVRVICTGRGRDRHDRLTLVTLTRARGTFEARPADGYEALSGAAPPIMVRDEKASRIGYAEHRRRDEPARVPLSEYGEEPAPSPVSLACPRCGWSAAVYTGAGSSLALLFADLDREPPDAPGAVLRFDRQAWRSPRGDTFGPRVLDVRDLD